MMIITLLCCIAALSPSAASPVFGLGSTPHRFSRDHYAREFSAWQYLHGIGLNWDDQEWTRRLDIFADAHDFIEGHNAAGNHTFKLAHNQFSHMTHDEWKAERLSAFKPQPDPSLPRNMLVESDPAILASSIDWVSAGAVTNVKDQGSCGSCWSFSSTGAVEGAYFVTSGELVSLSEQQLVSCDKTDNGCDGGLMDNAFSWVEKNGGLCSEADYPYASAGGTAPACKTLCSEVDGTAVTGYTDVTNTVNGLMTALNTQPVSIAIQADQTAFQYYSEGVMTGTCGTKLDHGVLAVGYGTTSDGVDYWKVKNSWSETWGEDGYIRIERGADDKCGVLLQASYPSL